MLQRTFPLLVATHVVLSIGSTLFPAPASARPSDCPPDSVQAGTWCVDKYEASVWQTDDARAIEWMRDGRIRTEGELAGRAVRRGLGVNDYDAAGCPASGNGCTHVFAASVGGVRPSVFITWFQAAAACRNVGKQLLPNATWQAAALGTPDPGVNGDGVSTCNTNNSGSVPSGSTGNCVSDVGAFDMVGNVSEWVADWVPTSSGCVAPLFNSGDFNCYAGGGIPSPGSPAAPLRGGDYGNRTAAGVFTVNALLPVDNGLPDLGFRCGRPAGKQWP